MKLATLKDGTRDGALVVVSRDLRIATLARGVAPTMQAALERWDEVERPLHALYERVNAPEADGAFPFDPARAESPLPRAYQWIDGSVFAHHGKLMARALHPDKELSYETYPLVYQGASDDFIGRA